MAFACHSRGLRLIDSRLTETGPPAHPAPLKTLTSAGLRPVDRRGRRAAGGGARPPRPPPTRPPPAAGGGGAAGGARAAAGGGARPTAPCVFFTCSTP